MELQITETTYTTADLSWLDSSFTVGTAKPVTVLISECFESTHYPDGFLKPGTLLAEFTSGANAGLWAPFQQDNVEGEGLATVAGVALDGFKISKDASGALVATVTAGAAILAGYPCAVIVSKLPGLLLADDSTAYAPVAGDLPSSFIAR